MATVGVVEKDSSEVLQDREGMRVMPQYEKLNRIKPAASSLKGANLVAMQHDAAMFW
jgi:hypothetical protein